MAAKDRVVLIGECPTRENDGLALGPSVSGLPRDPTTGVGPVAPRLGPLTRLKESVGRRVRPAGDALAPGPAPSKPVEPRLPPGTAAHTRSFGAYTAHAFHNPEGEKVGEIFTTPDGRSDGHHDVLNIRVHPSYQGQGYAGHLYRYAATHLANEGKNLYTTQLLTHDGRRLQHSLRKQGVIGEDDQVRPQEPAPGV